MSDPSESVESSRIMPLLQDYFEIVDLRPYGGTVLHLLFSDIAANFRDDSEKTDKLLSLCFQIEDTLLEIGELESDFVFVVCKPR